MSVETPEEEARDEEGHGLHAGAFHALSYVRGLRFVPAGQLSRQYKDLAHAVNPGLAAQIARNQQGAGGYD